jgi:hypothetical protein
MKMSVLTVYITDLNNVLRDHHTKEQTYVAMTLLLVLIDRYKLYFYLNIVLKSCNILLI